MAEEAKAAEAADKVPKGRSYTRTIGKTQFTVFSISEETATHIAYPVIKGLIKRDLSYIQGLSTPV